MRMRAPNAVEQKGGVGREEACAAVRVRTRAGPRKRGPVPRQPA